MQRALLRAYEKIGQFEGRSAFKTWLFTIAYRELAMLRRSGRAGPSLVEWSEAPASDAKVGAEIDANLDLHAALSRLPTEERTAVLLCDAYGFSNREAADLMRKPLGTVKTFVRRGRAALRRMLKMEDDE